MQAGTGGIVGIAEEDALSLFGDEGLRVLRLDAPVVLLVGGEEHGHAAGVGDLLLVSEEGRIRYQQFVAGVDRGKAGQEAGIGAGRRDQHIFRGDLDAEIPFIGVDDRLNGVGITFRRGVVGVAFEGILISCGEDGLGRGKVRIADGQVDQIVHALGESCQLHQHAGFEFRSVCDEFFSHLYKFLPIFLVGLDKEHYIILCAGKATGRVIPAPH